MIYIVDDIGAVVASMREGYEDKYEYAYEGASGAPFYMYGHRQEIANRLTANNQDKVQKKRKYPLIALKLDTVEDVRGNVNDFVLNLVIATISDVNSNAEDRMTKTFKPILYPLYEQFMNAFSTAGLFMWDDQLDQLWPPHQKIDRPFWGTPGNEGNIKNIFNDPIDAIEIVNMKFSRENPIY